MNEPNEKEVYEACNETLRKIFDILESIPQEHQTYTLALNILYNFEYHIIKICSMNDKEENTTMTRQNARYRMFTELNKAVLVRLQELDEREYEASKENNTPGPNQGSK